MAPTQTQKERRREGNVATRPYRTPAGDEAADGQRIASRSGFFRGVIIAIVVSIPLWIALAVGAVWLLR